MRDAGIGEVGIIVGDTQAEIRAAVGDGASFGLAVTYIPQDAPRGLAHAVLISEPFLAGEPFVMYLGDNLLADGITGLVDEFVRDQPDALILLQHVTDPSSFGIAELDAEGRVTRLVEKPHEPKSDLALVGVYMFTDAIWESVKAIEPSPRGELEITDAIQHLVDRGLTVRPHIVTGWWKDTGRREDMLDANRLVLDTIESRCEGTLGEDVVLEGRVVVEQGAVLERCLIRGPVVIGKRARIADAFIGPYTSISDDVVIERAEIEYSIILERARIVDLDARIESSLVGRDALITRSDQKPRAHRFMVGDSSQIWVL
ncbi:MAG: glucose-phosphate thymidylyltransferase [Acidimicrobiaceae bacterium]|nr:glucose-phosphate thymidylyltransferase [Acidimicrobiaceae bacterium]